MRIPIDRRMAILGGSLAVALTAAGIWALAGSGTTPNASGPPSTSASNPSGPTTPPPSPRTGATAPAPSHAQMTVKVFFHKGETVVAVRRTVPRSAKVATVALNQLLAGPTKAERDAGYWSFFSAQTAKALRGVEVREGVAHADFANFSRVIPNASSSAGSAALLAELDNTLKQFATVRSTVYSFDGDVVAFYEWLQMAPPTRQPTMAEAVTEARSFLTTVVGMTGLANKAPRSVAGGNVAVDFQVRAPNGGLAAPITTVLLRRSGAWWVASSVSTDTIQVTTPRSGATVTSPMSVTGRALAYEGTVTIRVEEPGGGKMVVLGEGYVTGGGDVVRPFRGSVGFAPPSSTIGWVVFVELSPADGTVTKATVVPVTLTPVRIDVEADNSSTRSAGSAAS